MKKVISHNAERGTTTYFHSTPDAIHIERVQDVSGIVEDAKNVFNNTDERARWGELAHVATIPLSIMYDLKAKGIADDEKAMKKWLNDPDNRYFRTRPGVV